jgi:octaprenyl-diphosphate synthase
VKDSKQGLQELLGPIAPGLERMRAILSAQVRESSPAVRDMTDHVARFQGKQLRGALVLLSGEATGNTTDEHAAVAAIVEMIHLATLVHDDILDGAEVRRRVACVNQRWDNQVAVLLGDFLYARAFALSTQLSSRLCSRLLAETTRTLCVGEIEQSTRRYDFEMSSTVYESIASAKTASLYAAACELGARYPAGNEALGARLSEAGRRLGLAFQIVDDCLDLTGTEAELGKSVGTDVEDGKITLPVLFAYRRADEVRRAAIRDAYTRPGIVDRRAALLAACDLASGVEEARARANELQTEALAIVGELAPSSARHAMERLFNFVLTRSQ